MESLLRERVIPMDFSDRELSGSDDAVSITQRPAR
jgi:hypothetical protein